MTSPPSTEQKLSLVYERGYVVGMSGAKRPILGAISRDEALCMVDLIRKNNLKTSLETGVANGLSELAIALAVQEQGGHHFGVDPCQKSDHDEAATALMEEFVTGNDVLASGITNYPC